MIKVKVEIHPHGHEDEKETIKEIDIINNLSNKDRPTYGNYDVVIDGEKHKNVVKDHHRKDDILVLLRDILNNIIK